MVRSHYLAYTIIRQEFMKTVGANDDRAVSIELSLDDLHIRYWNNP